MELENILKRKDIPSDVLEEIKRYVVECDKLEQQLREKEEKYRLIADYSGDIITVLDMNLKILYVSPSFIRVLGYSTEEITGMSIEDLLIPSSATLFLSTFKTAQSLELKGKKIIGNIASLELKYYRKDRVLTWMELNFSFMRDKENKVISVVAINRDISKRKEVEKEKIEAERMGAIGLLAKGAAHDFNNALQAIITNIELTLRLSKLPEKAIEYLEIAKKRAKSASSRVFQLQRFAKDHNSERKHKAIDINKLLELTINQTRPLWKDEIEKRGLEIVIEKKFGQIKSIDGDRNDLVRVFYNLIINAIEAMPRGGKITFDTGIVNKDVYVRIIDTGNGMDTETQQKAFDPYYTTKGARPGKGMGMSAAYIAVKEHRGQISIKETELGKRTMIEVLFPIGEMKKKMIKKCDEYDNQIKAKILWVDDDKDILKVGKEILEQLGHQADIAISGQEALEKLKNNFYDLLITDLGMPGMSGWQLAEAIQGKYPTMKVAVLTGWGANDFREEMQKYEVEFVLCKPITIKNLNNLIGTVLTLKK